MEENGVTPANVDKTDPQQDDDEVFYDGGADDLETPDDDAYLEELEMSPEEIILDAAADFIALVRDGDAETLRMGVERFGKEKTAQYSTALETRLGGVTAFTLAAELGNEDIVSLFIEVGADVNAKNGTGGWTPLHCAASQGIPRVFNSLLT